MATTPDDLLVESVLKLLEAGPLPMAVLVERLRALGRLEHLVEEGIDEEEMAAVVLEILDTDAIWSTPDHVLCLSATLLDGLVLTHRLTPVEKAEGGVAVTPDLVILDWDAEDGLRLPGGGRLEHHSGVHVPGHDLSTFRGPDGWLDRFAAGDVLAFTRRGADVEVTTVVELHDDSHEVELLRGAAHARIPPGTGEEAVPVVLDALVADPSAFRRPLRPVGELLEAAGFERRGFAFGRCDEEWRSYPERYADDRGAERRRRWRFDPCCEAAFETVASAFDRSATCALDDDELGAIAQPLEHGNVASAFAAEVLDRYPGGGARLTAFAEAVLARTRRHPAPARLLLALEAERRGDATEAEAQLRAALSAEPGYSPVALALARYEIDRSNVARAITLLRRPEVGPGSPALEFLEQFRADAEAPRRSVGRNDPCPCGSGRKFKACCQRTAPIPLAKRTALLSCKLTLFAGTDRNRPRLVGIASSACDPDDPDLIDRMVELTHDSFVVDIALFEGGLAEAFLDERGILLPPDERELLGRLIDERRRLWEVVEVDPGVSLALRDTATGDHVVVAERRASRDRGPGEYLLARIARLGNECQLFGETLAVPLRLRQRTIELVDADPDADMLAEWYGEAVAPPLLVTRENEPVVLCRAHVATHLDPLDLHAALDPWLEPEGDGAWVDTHELEDGDVILRGSVRATGEGLLVEANSEARFDRLLDVVVGAVPDASVIDETREDAASLVREGGDAPDHRPFDESPELQALMDEVIRRKEAEWLDAPVPALGGLTPRQARDDPTRREDLLAILREAEADSSTTGARGFDPDRLRKLLELET